MARPVPWELHLANGTAVQVLLKGSAWNNWLEDLQGNVVVRSDEDGQYYYQS
ncbi:unnamed protein product, partial [Heterosigma akashiwo]